MSKICSLVKENRYIVDSLYMYLLLRTRYTDVTNYRDIEVNPLVPRTLLKTSFTVLTFSVEHIEVAFCYPEIPLNKIIHHIESSFKIFIRIV